MEREGGQGAEYTRRQAFRPVIFEFHPVAERCPERCWSGSMSVTESHIRPVRFKVGRAEAEDFLIHEAALLDSWQLKEWLKLFTDDACYEMPAPDLPQSSDPSLTYSLICDNRKLIEHRALRLLKPHAHAEFPHSETRRLITNVRVLSDDDNQAVVAANFAIFRSFERSQTYFTGRYEHRLRKVAGELKFSLRKVFLDQSELDPQGRVGVIVWVLG